MPVLSPVTSEDAWLKFLDGAPLWNPRHRPLVVVSPHPDDETLGAGGLIAMRRRAGIPVSIIAVTDGEAAYPGVPGLAWTRRAEQESAAAELGVSAGSLVRLGLPDSRVTLFEEKLAHLIRPHVGPETQLIAPWPGDPHPDHEASGRAALSVAQQCGCGIAFYLFWTWHRNSPTSVRCLALRRLEIPAEAQTARARALACHRSQLKREEDEPILPEVFLGPARRRFETFIVND